MSTPPAGASAAHRLPAFAIACWVLGLVAFTQLLVAALALAVRFEESRQVRVVEKEVPKIVPVRIPVPAEPSPEADRSIVARPPVAEPREEPAPEPTPLAAPAVADPRSERLVQEARQARIAGDMGLAILKLEEARVASPDDPTVHYELGLVHEAMGVFDTAAAHYETVFQMGLSGAGSLYEAAASKLRDGFEQPGDMLGKIALDRVRIFKDPNHKDGELVILTIPVQKAPGVDIDPGEVEVMVNFFNRTSKNEIVPLEDDSWVSQKWLSLPADWADGEESIRMTYVIPARDETTAHLFGSLAYYGQVVTLSYKGEIMDVQAWPRDLAARLPHQNAAGQEQLQFPEFMDQLPPDFDPENPLLPKLPE